MTDWLLQGLASWGLPLLFLTTLASCLALPVPSSLMMLAAGAFVASGDLTATSVILAALMGAIIGDQIGFWVGRQGEPLIQKWSAEGKKGKLIRRASALLNDWGGIGVFLSRWLFSPLGPYVNFVGGAAGLHHIRFTLWGGLGEVVWVSIYVGLGMTFADNIAAAAELAGDTIGILAGSVLTLGFGMWLLRALRKARKMAHAGTE